MSDNNYDIKGWEQFGDSQGQAARQEQQYGDRNSGQNQGGYQNRQNNYQGGGGGNRYQNNQGGGNGGWQNRGNGGNGGGGWNRNPPSGGGGFSKSFQRREEDTGPAVLYKPYVITGNDEAPQEVLDRMVAIVKDLEKAGYTLRNGGMKGPEDITEKAATNKEVHLPWKGFDNKDSKFTFTSNHAKDLAKQFHPAFDGVKPVVQTFLAKNVRMIMGKDLKSPALFLITWSMDGAETMAEKSIKTGTTGHSVAIACALRIPVFNLQKPDAEKRLRAYLNLNGQEQTQTSNDGPGF
jgi:hypothetical protein